MSINNLEKGEQVAWKLFSKTGSIKYYGMCKGFEDLKQEEMKKESEQNQMQ